MLFKTNGELWVTDDIGTNRIIVGEWLTVAPDSVYPALYEVQRVQGSGSLGLSYTGGLGTSSAWNAMTSDQGITATAGAVSRTNTSTYNFRVAGGPGTVVATATITVTSDP